MAGTVTVACKMPAGLILHVDEMVDYDEPVQGGGIRSVKRAQQKGEPVRVNGYAVPFGQAPAVVVQGGYALTHNVDADFWNAWIAQNKTSDLVRNRIIFALDKPESASSKAREHEKVRNGFEPLDPSHLPRGIEPGSRSAA